MPLLQLIEDCKNSDRKAQRKLYEQFAPAMLSLCVRYLGGRETARDALQEGFLRVFTKIDDYRSEGSFEGWLKRIFINTALEMLRRQRTEREYRLDIDDVDVKDENYAEFTNLSADDLLNIISELPPARRTVFNLHAIEGYDYAEIAQKLNTKEVTVRSLFFRARESLQEKVRKFTAL